MAAVAPPADLRVSVDVGGTYTDLVVHDPHGDDLLTAKVPSTPAHPASAIVSALDEAGIDLRRVAVFAHGSTVGTNALLTRSLARTALVTTAGFRDVLEIRRGDREHLWDAYQDPPPPLLARRDRFELDERIDYEGTVVESLDAAGARDVAETIARRGYEAVAVCLVNAHVDGRHERAFAEVLAAVAPELSISLSSDVAPLIFEHERTSTTVITAALAPVVGGYLRDLESTLAARGFAGDVLVLHSGGGVMTAKAMAAAAARIAKSGPAAGAVAMADTARVCGFAHAIGLDIGGTSSDVSLLVDGELAQSDDSAVEFGHPISFPSIEVHTVGAGGGSIAWLDPGGALRSGPHAAGADPGPAAYGRGGTEATTTDALLVLGRMGAAAPLAGGLALDADAAARALREGIAATLGCGIEEAAAAVVAVVEANVADAVRLVLARRGLDPREFALVAFGGAGPLLACAAAAELGIATVLVPPNPGLASAAGGLLLDLRHDLQQPLFTGARRESWPAIAATLAGLEAAATTRIRDEGHAEDESTLGRSVDLRYRGQWRSLTMALRTPDADGLMAAVDAFHAEHAQRFGFARPAIGVEVHTVRVAVHIDLPRVTAPARPGPARPGTPRQREVILDLRTLERVPVSVLQRDELAGGVGVPGPAIVEQMDSTILVPEGAIATPVAGGILRIELGAAA